MSEDTNTSVDEVVNDSELSTDKEVDLDSMNEEELRDFAKREREAKERAVAHMKAQADKRKSIEETVQGKEVNQVQTDDSTATQTIEELRAEAKRLVQEEHREARIAEHSLGSTDWLKSQTWSGDIIKSDTLYGEFSKELKRLAETKDVHSQAGFRKLMRIAAVTVTGKADALLEESVDAEINFDKQQSGGYKPSSSPSVQGYSGLSEADRKLIERLNAKRQARGEEPLRQGDIFKK